HDGALRRPIHGANARENRLTAKTNLPKPRNWFALRPWTVLTEPVIDEPFFPTTDVLRSRDKAQLAFHERAARVAGERFGRRVFLRAVVEVSNFCRENCSYCGMRRDNRDLARHRARLDQLAELLVHHRPASVTDVNLQS